MSTTSTVITSLLLLICFYDYRYFCTPYISGFRNRRHDRSCDLYSSSVSSVDAFSVQQHNKGKRIKPLPYRSNDPLDIERSILLNPTVGTMTNTNNSNNKTRYQFVIGTDESGTGCIAGPIIVVSCCIVFPKPNNKTNDVENDNDWRTKLPPLLSHNSTTGDTTTTTTINIMDSKSLSAMDCERIYHHVQLHPSVYTHAVTYIHPNEMDDNSNATIPQLIRRAMANSMEQLIDQQLLSHISAHDRRPVHVVPQLPPKVSVPIYGIVDGHRSVSPNDFYKYSFPCRPYKHGDRYVYTVALASCLARHYHELGQREYHVQYPQYQFHIHGGYPTAQHVQAIHSYGIIPNIHRTNCQPILQRKLLSSSQQQQSSSSSSSLLSSFSNDDKNDTNCTIFPIQTATTPGRINVVNRQSFLSSSSVSMLLGWTTALFVTSTIQQQAPRQLLRIQPPFSSAMYMDSKNGISYPNIGEIEAAIPDDWTRIDNPFEGVDVSSYFTRLDTSQDSIFYNQPRFVEHIDTTAVQSITQYIDDLVMSFDSSASITCLDLCASWTSHMSSSTTTRKRKLQRMVGLGMNEKELQANTVLTEYVVQDLNDQPRLPFPSDSFDIVLCQLSIDYLIEPFQVCREIARILRQNNDTAGRGGVYIFFSNRSFLSKAVGVWTGKDDIDHAFTVASYLCYCSRVINSGSSSGGSNYGNDDSAEVMKPLFTNIQAHDLSKRSNGGRVIGDPLYVVSAMKS